MSTGTARSRQIGVAMATRKSASAKRTVSAKAKRKTRNVAKKSARAVQDRPARKAFAYSDRVTILADALKEECGGDASLSELFDVVQTGDSGMFATPRRVSATYRQNVRHLPEADQPFTFDGRRFHIAKRNRKSRKTANVSRKRTRSAK